MTLEKLRKALKDEKVIFGTEKTLKNLRLGKTKAVFIASNCPTDIKEKIKKYKVEVIELKEPNDEIALICKRPHSISILSY
ncbi:MAG: ribosomal L7Ae/L30e/S12e/Gadd45 family protein [Nanoarchaeota archaeon]